MIWEGSDRLSPWGEVTRVVSRERSSGRGPSQRHGCLCYQCVITWAYLRAPGASSEFVLRLRSSTQGIARSTCSLRILLPSWPYQRDEARGLLGAFSREELWGPPKCPPSPNWVLSEAAALREPFPAHLGGGGNTLLVLGGMRPPPAPDPPQGSRQRAR